MKEKILTIIKKKWLRSITLTIVLFAIIIAGYLGILYATQILNLPDLDCTAEKLYSISQATEDRVQKIDKEVVIYIYNMYDYINDFARKYNQINKNIKVEELTDLSSKASWKATYGVDSDDSFIMISSGDKEKMLTQSDLYTIDYSTYQEIDTTEEAFTNAILDVVTNVKPKIYFLEGHNLYDNSYFYDFEEALTSELNEVEHLNLLTEAVIPEDCKMIIITTLKNDINKKESDVLLEYVKKGGDLLLLIDPNLNQIKTPNFNKILDEYGCSVDEGFILEADTSKMLAGTSNLVVSQINSTSEIVKNINMDINLCTMLPGRINIASSEELEKKNVTAEVLATVSDKAFYREDLNEESLSRVKSDKDASGATIAASFVKEIDENSSSKMIIIANTVCSTSIQPLGNNYNTIFKLYNNEDILINSVSYLTDREENITIRKNVETVTTYDMTAQELYIVLTIILAIPIIIIIFGIVIWIIRRRKK